MIRKKTKSRFLSRKGHEVSTRGDEEGFKMQVCHVRALSIRCVPRYPDSTHRRAMRSNAARVARIRILFKVLAAIMLLPLLEGKAFASCTGSNRIWHNSAECLVAQ